MGGVYRFDLANADPVMVAEVSAEAQRVVEADGDSNAVLPAPQPGHKLAVALLRARDVTDEALWGMDLHMSRERTEPGIEDFPPFQELVTLSGISLTNSVNELREEIDRLLATDILITTFQDPDIAREMYPDGTSVVEY
ncbi:hypothetical protein H8Z55_17450 [Mycobacteroides abscessus]|uniref:hypothetical protein n=1 Tax=Mycobacteroides abscessus TaxID=36809 RepID=UPI001CDCF141|nr:hypothetical protein [Mycobacteroides abscessus]MCA4749577.1 hypothetical protein [Mycobacteroides abscessus]MCA4767249.1 hypothetical protein [Mycobacteroides abscessus]UBV08836.1 hypothetical protein H8Z55_17450 [Mycobacteroides abscessus]UBV26028.1 hypothetical protein H8Z67_17380 [Mycobacteroides abscessus]